MNIKIDNDKRAFFQWDTNQKLVIEGADGCQEVHFCPEEASNAMVCKITEEGENRIVVVPNVLLQEAGHITAYIFRVDNEGQETKYARSFKVIPRAKPDDYVYTETEVWNYKKLEERLIGMKEFELVNAVAAHLEEHPVETGATAEEAAQIKQNAENIKKLSDNKLDASKLPEVVTDALAQAKASGEFKGDRGEQGPQGEKGEQGEPGPQGSAGADGKTPVRGVDYWTDEDIEAIKGYWEDALCNAKF